MAELSAYYIIPLLWLPVEQSGKCVFPAPLQSGLPTLVFSTNRTQANLAGGAASNGEPTAAAVFVGGGVG